MILFGILTRRKFAFVYLTIALMAAGLLSLDARSHFGAFAQSYVFHLCLLLFVACIAIATPVFAKFQGIKFIWSDAYILGAITVPFVVSYSWDMVSFASAQGMIALGIIVFFALLAIPATVFTAYTAIYITGWIYRKRTEKPPMLH